MAHEGSHVFSAREQHNVHLHPHLHHNICTATARAAFYLLLQLNLKLVQLIQLHLEPSELPLNNGCSGLRFLHEFVRFIKFPLPRLLLLRCYSP